MMRRWSTAIKTARAETITMKRRYTISRSPTTIFSAIRLIIAGTSDNDAASVIIASVIIASVGVVAIFAQRHAPYS